MEKGVKLVKIKRSELDANPPEPIKKKIEMKLSKIRSRKTDRVPEDLVGKGGKAYILTNWIVHRGKSSPKVNKYFKEAVRLVGTEKEH